MITVNNKKFRYILVSISFVIMIGIGCGKGILIEELPSIPPVTQENKPPSVTITPDLEENISPPETVISEPTDPSVPPITEVITPPEKTQSSQEKPFWQSETTRQVNNLMAIASAGQLSYKKSGPQRGWMSKNGKLYSYYDNKYITTDDLVTDGYLEKGLPSGEYELLLINGSDLQQFNGTTVPADSTGFSVFAVTKQSDKYLFASPSGKVGFLSAKEYSDLLALYEQDHGAVVRLSSAAAEYETILTYIGLFQGKLDSYFVREVRKDDKYAVVVFSSTTNTADIRQYVLKNDNNFWEVALPDMQSQTYPITAVNRYLPDFNVDILPSYTLASWRGNIMAEQGGAVAALFSARVIESSSEIYYLCATNNCAYVVLNNGDAYACYEENGIWNAQEVQSDYEANNIFKEKANADYGFLILDD